MSSITLQVPSDFRKAAVDILDSFVDACEPWGEYTASRARSCLYGESREPIGQPDGIDLDLAMVDRFKYLLAPGTPAAILRACCELYFDGLIVAARPAFRDLLRAAQKHPTANIDPFELAEHMAQQFGRLNIDRISAWLSNVCGITEPQLRIDEYLKKHDNEIARAKRKARIEMRTIPSQNLGQLDTEPLKALLADVRAQWMEDIRMASESKGPDVPDCVGDRGQQTIHNLVPTGEGSPEPQATKRRARKPSKLSSQAQKRRATIRHLSDLGFDGREYCTEVDKELQFSLLRKYSREPGAPRTYMQAFEHPDKKWRQAIWDEKYRITKRLKR